MTEETELDAAPPNGGVLHVRVGPGMLAGAASFAVQAAAAADAGEPFTPYFEVGFAQMGQMLAVFTPKRWDLVSALRQAGPSSVRALAQRLQRDYKNVHGDVAALEEWMAVQRLPDGRVYVPWSEIVMDVKLPQAQAA